MNPNSTDPFSWERHLAAKAPWREATPTENKIPGRQDRTARRNPHFTPSPGGSLKIASQWC
jgi:hypothetical protein